jgi:hypothetical protein
MAFGRGRAGWGFGSGSKLMAKSMQDLTSIHILRPFYDLYSQAQYLILSSTTAWRFLKFERHNQEKF